MKQYTKELNKKVEMILNNTGYSNKKIEKYMAVYQKLIKYMDNSTRTVSRKSCEIYKLIKNDWKYNKHKKCFGYDYFKKIIKDLENLGLILLSKVGKYQKIFIPRLNLKGEN